MDRTLSVEIRDGVQDLTGMVRTIADGIWTHHIP